MFVVIAQIAVLFPAGTGETHLNAFSNGSFEGAAVFGPEGGNSTPLELELPGSALVLDASLSLEGLPAAVSGERTYTTDQDFGASEYQRNITISDGKVSLSTAKGGWSQQADAQFSLGTAENLEIGGGVRLARGPRFKPVLKEFEASPSCRTQSRPVCAIDSNSNLVIAWEDLRSGTSLDIYCRRFDQNGTPLGPDILVCDAARHQYNPAVAVDGNGRFAVLWQDGRSGDFDIMGRIYDSSGNPVATEFGVCNADGDQSRPAACFGPGNNLLVAWDDYRDDHNFGVYSILLDSNGGQAGMETPLARGITDRVAPSACKLPNGYAVAWQNLSNISGSDIEGAQLNSAGQPNTPFIVVNASGNQSCARLASDQAGNFAVVWQDCRGADFDIRGRWLLPSGAPAGPETVLCLASQDQKYPSLSVLPSGGSLVAWEDHRGVNSTVYFKRFSSAWNCLGTETPMPDPKADQMTPSVALDASGASILAWCDWSEGVPNIHVTKFGQPRYVYSSGMLVSPPIPSFAATFGSVGLCITLPRTARSPANTTGFRLDILDGREGYVLQSGCLPGGHIKVDASDHDSIRLAIYLYTLDENITPVLLRWSVGTGLEDGFDVPNGGVYSQTRAKNGTVSLQSDGTLANMTPDVTLKGGSSSDFQVSLAKLPDESFVASWRNGDAASGNISARRFARDGTAVTDEIAVCNLPGSQTEPKVAVDLNGQITVVWSDNRSLRDHDIYARRFTAAGAPVGGELLVCGTSDEQMTPVIATDLDNNFVVAWVDWAKVYSLLFMQKFGPDGVALFSPVQVSWTQWNLLVPAIAVDSQNRIIVSWSDSRGGAGDNYDIYASVFGPDGKALTPGKDIEVCVRAGNQFFPSIAVAPDDSFIIAWEDRAQVSDYNVYARKFGADQKPVGAEFAISAAASDQSSPALAFDSKGNFMAAWATLDSAFDIHGRYFGPTGVPLGAELIICNVLNVVDQKPADQMLPAIACGPNDEFSVAWVDGRPKYDMDIWAKIYGFARYYPSGTYLTPAYDIGFVPLSLDGAGWSAVRPPKTSVSAQLRTAPDGATWSGWEAAAEVQNSISSPPARFIQWQFTLGTTDLFSTPQLLGLHLEYTTYATNGTLTSPPVNAGFHASQLRVWWTAGENGGKLRLQATADNGTSWHACTSGVPLELPSGADLSVIRYRAFLYSTSATTPYLDEVGLNFSAVSYPFDPGLDLGADGELEWNLSGPFCDTVQLSGLEKPLNAILARAGLNEGTLKVPVMMRSDTGGMIRVSNLSLHYDVPPVIQSSFPVASELVINETERARFAVNPFDGDGDNLDMFWTSNGRVVGGSGPEYTFVTDHNSSGTYNITVTVSDKYFTVNISWRLTVLDFNRAPVLGWDPVGDVTIAETEKATFWATASDPDGTNVSLGWYLDGKQVGGNGSYEYVADYNSSGTHIVTVQASDGRAIAQHNWTVTVTNRNRAPQILRQDPLKEMVPKIRMGEPCSFGVVATDPDGDRLTYAWKLNGAAVAGEQGQCYTCRRGLVSGMNTVRVEVSDGTATVWAEWSVRLSVPTITTSSSQPPWGLAGAAVLVAGLVTAIVLLARRKGREPPAGEPPVEPPQHPLQP
jgi:hypothetical protein